MSNNSYSYPVPFSTIEEAEDALRTHPASFWEERGERAALDLFHSAAERVPAYKDFLQKENIDHTSIETIQDFAKVTPVHKDNYLRQYPLEALSWDGKLFDTWNVYAATSGSTGEPFFFPRSEKETERYAFLAELYLRTQFNIQEQSTLYIDSFAMGAWIGGLFTYQAIERIAKSGKYKLHLITPGINKQETLKIIAQLAPQYDQIVIGGYPPFTRDLIDEGTSLGFKWEKYKVKFVFSAEGFGERFRDHIAEAASLKNPLRDMVNHYGTVDQGTLAYETPLSIFMRRTALEDTKLYSSLFSEPTRLPTLTQYIPEHFFFETNDQNGIICTSDAGLPLVRYDLKDHGGVHTFDSAYGELSTSVDGLDQKLTDAGIADTVFRLPFVHVYERSDFSVVLYGANVYPEHVRHALETPELSQYATGKCVLRIVEDRSAMPKLEIHLELRKYIDASSAIGKVAQKIIVDTLLHHNSEYRSNHAQSAKKMKPKIKLWEYNHPTHFSGKGKQKWSVK